MISSSTVPCFQIFAEIGHFMRPRVEVNLDILAGLQRLSTLCQPGLCFLLFAILSTELHRGVFIRFKLESTLKALVEIETRQTRHFSRKNDVRNLK